ncbi:hypothetical protein V5799_013168 [Amblyomma americanum]|uniref:Poly(A) RNA polymerase mitochondrial-like central palm domain-containing protein n=1 Tax=Amblyomma americanum TaxID=6943 RepID=A0AAQ4E6M1_AMBAM
MPQDSSSHMLRKRRWDDGEEQERPQVKRRLPAPNQAPPPRPVGDVREAGPPEPVPTPQVAASGQQCVPGAAPDEHDKWAAVSSALWAHYRARQHTEDLLQRKMELRKRLHDKLRVIFPLCGLYVVGSSLTGFGSNVSDADMCLMLSQDQVDQRYQAMAILNHVARLLAKTGE